MRGKKVARKTRQRVARKTRQRVARKTRQRVARKTRQRVLVGPYRLGFVAGRDAAIVSPQNALGGLEGMRRDESDDWDREYSRGYADALERRFHDP